MKLKCKNSIYRIKKRFEKLSFKTEPIVLFLNYTKSCEKSICFNLKIKVAQVGINCNPTRNGREYCSSSCNNRLQPILMLRLISVQKKTIFERVQIKLQTDTAVKPNIMECTLTKYIAKTVRKYLCLNARITSPSQYTWLSTPNKMTIFSWHKEQSSVLTVIQTVIKQGNSRLKVFLHTAKTSSFLQLTETQTVYISAFKMHKDERNKLQTLQILVML